MQVKELIAKLQQLDQTLPVVTPMGEFEDLDLVSWVGIHKVGNNAIIGGITQKTDVVIISTYDESWREKAHD